MIINTQIKGSGAAPEFYIAVGPDASNLLIKKSPVVSLPSTGSITGIGTRGLYYEYFGASLDAGTNVNWSGITSVGDYGISYAFRNATGLGSVDLRNLTTVSSTQGAQYAFAGSSITSLDMRSLTAATGMNYLCNGCSDLASVNLTDLQTLSATYMFQNCTGLTSISLPNLTTITSGSYTFAGCTSLTTADLSGLTGITTSGSMTSFFNGCSALTSVDLSGVKQLGNATTTNICAGMFTGCSALTSVDLSGLEKISFTGTSLSSAPFASMFTNTHLTSVDLSSLQTIEGKFGAYRMFYNCPYLTTVTMGNTPISGAFHSTFEGCTGLSNINFFKWKENANSDFNYYNTFSLCTGINTPITISGLKWLSAQVSFNSTFLGCSNIPSATFPDLRIINVNDAMSAAFSGCSALTSITFSRLQSLAMSGFGALGGSQSAPLNIYFPCVSQINTNVFSNLLAGMTSGANITLHFPSNKQSTVEALNGYPSFGSSGATVNFAYDQPATQYIYAGAIMALLYRDYDHDTDSALAWWQWKNNTADFDTMYYTSGTTYPQDGDNVYSDAACTQVYTTITEMR